MIVFNPVNKLLFKFFGGGAFLIICLLTLFFSVKGCKDAQDEKRLIDYNTEKKDNYVKKEIDKDLKKSEAEKIEFEEIKKNAEVIELPPTEVDGKPLTYTNEEKKELLEGLFKTKSKGK